MRIVCPACAAAYEVPEDRLPPGRAVRCARCDTDWAPIAEVAPERVMERVAFEPEPEPEPAVVVPEPAPIVASAPEVASGRPEPAALLWLAWLLSIALLLGAAWFAYAARDAVMQAWPPSVRAYAALGLAGRH